MSELRKLILKFMIGVEIGKMHVNGSMSTRKADNRGYADTPRPEKAGKIIIGEFAKHVNAVRVSPQILRSLVIHLDRVIHELAEGKYV